MHGVQSPLLRSKYRCCSTFALVTGNDTDPNYVAKNKDADGTDLQGQAEKGSLNHEVVLNLVHMQACCGASMA
jgi:hypothetical protein